MATDWAHKFSGRQYPLVAVIDFDYSTFVTGTVYRVLDLPGGAILRNVTLRVQTIFNNTTPIFAVGLSTEGDADTDPDSLIDDAALTAVEGFAADLGAQADEGNLDEAAGLIPSTGAGVNVKLGTTGQPTAGRAQLLVEYVVASRAQENQG
jgi:hypothetical protein